MIIPYLKLMAEQNKMSDKAEDRLDRVIRSVHEQIEELSDDSLMHIQAAIKMPEQRGQDLGIRRD